MDGKTLVSNYVNALAQKDQTKITQARLGVIAYVAWAMRANVPHKEIGRTIGSAVLAAAGEAAARADKNGFWVFEAGQMDGIATLLKAMDARDAPARKPRSVQSPPRERQTSPPTSKVPYLRK